MAIQKGKPREKLLSVLDRSLRSVFGESAASAVRYRLEERYLLKLEDIPERPQAFTKALKEMFGETGAEIVETLLVKDLTAKLGIDGEEDEDNLIACFDKLKTAHNEK